jgi:hypothetical protein
MAVAWTVVLEHCTHTATARERLEAICVVLLLTRLWLDPAVTLARSESVIFAGWAKAIDDAAQSTAASIARIMEAYSLIVVRATRISPARPFRKSFAGCIG